VSEFHSSGDLLANVFCPGASPQKLTLITGPRGSGKTTWCRELYQEALRCDIKPEGLISIPVFVENQKIGIDLQVLPMDECYPLATRRQNGAGYSLTKDWNFNPEIVQWGNRTLSQISHTRLLILDEIGPMEFHSQGGWQAAFPLVSRRDYHWAVVVIRPALLSQAQERWPWAEVLDVGDGVA